MKIVSPKTKTVVMIHVPPLLIVLQALRNFVQKNPFVNTIFPSKNKKAVNKVVNLSS